MSETSETFTVNIVVSNTVNVPVSIPGDYGSAIIPSIRDEEAFSLDLTFAVTSSVNGQTAITDIQSSFTPAIEGMNVVTSNTNPYAYKLRVSGTPTNVFPQTYTFLKNDFSVGNLSYSTSNSQWLAIVGWSPPSTTVVTVTHIFNITHDGGIANTSTPQNIVWDYNYGITRLNNLISQGDY